MLLFIANNEPWTGQPIDGVRHPLIIEQIWSDAELSNIGLKKHVPPPAEPRPLNANDVRAEAQRRIVELMGARNLEHCLIKQLNANMRANSLNDKRLLGGTLTSEEQAEAALLRGMETAIQAIRNASNVLEVMNPIPSDFTDDSRWP